MDLSKMSIEEKTQYWFNNPWTLAHHPFKVIDNVYFVGTNWVSVFLLNTEEGLVLIDCAMQETLYLLIDSIRALGFNPHDIKKLLLTHGHFDHCGAARAIQEMSGCEIWIGEAEEFFFTERWDLIVYEDRVPEFEITNFYDYDAKIDLGDIHIQPVHCPGHTPGTTSLFFDVKHMGKTLTCGIHGGLGVGVLTKKQLEKSGQPLSRREEYLESIVKVMDKKVDVVLPSHPSHCVDHDFLKIGDEDDGTGKGFINREAWHNMLISKKLEIEQMIQDDI